MARKSRDEDARSKIPMRTMRATTTTPTRRATRRKPVIRTFAVLARCT